MDKKEEIHPILPARVSKRKGEKQISGDAKRSTLLASASKIATPLATEVLLNLTFFRDGQMEEEGKCEALDDKQKLSSITESEQLASCAYAPVMIVITGNATYSNEVHQLLTGKEVSIGNEPFALPFKAEYVPELPSHDAPHSEFPVGPVWILHPATFTRDIEQMDLTGAIDTLRSLNGLTVTFPEKDGVLPDPKFIRCKERNFLIHGEINKERYLKIPDIILENKMNYYRTKHGTAHPAYHAH